MIVKTSLIEKTLELSELFKIYKELLTDKQKEYFELYIDEDLSLSEIAEEFNISKTAVYDSISKTSKLLFNLEKKLHLKQKEEKLIFIINQLEENQLDQKQLINSLKEVIWWKS
nr:putative DNA-binding protein [Mycoplasma feriruminatoris]